MALDDDEVERVQNEESPGPSDLESALVNETLSDAVSCPPLVVEADTSLAETLSLMRAHGRGCALITSAGKLAGIFTERDVLLKVAGQPIDLERTKVSAYMTAEPVALPADSSVAFALNRMLVAGFRHIPLVDEQGHPTGVVSMRELVEYLGDFFGKDLLTLPPEPRAASRNRDGA